MTLLLLALAGGLGAACRFVADALLKSRTRSALPVATILINVTGSFALGLVTGLALAGVEDETVRAVAGTGFLGGFTTFSTASVESARLALEGRRGRAVLASVGTLVVGATAAFAGLALGSLARL